MLLVETSACEESMRYRSALLLASFLGTAAAQAPSDEAQTLTGPVTIFLRSDSSIPSGVVFAIEREVEAVIAPAGIRVNWNAPGNTGSSELPTRIATMELRGHCSAAAPLPNRGLQQVAESLGQTHVMDGKVLPYADVQCDSVRRLIDRELRAARAGDRDDLLGRALGRVMAHELYHVLLRTTRHGRSGLGRPAQSSSDLVATRETFAQADERRLAGFAGR